MAHFVPVSVRRWPLPAALFVAALTAQAEPPFRPAKPDPLDPKASVPTLTYESAFAPYRRLGDEKPLSWREANDTVARIGGWRVYAREAQQPDPASPAKPAVPAAAAVPTEKSTDMPKPTPAGHGGHKSP